MPNYATAHCGQYIFAFTEKVVVKIQSIDFEVISQILFVFGTVSVVTCYSLLTLCDCFIVFVWTRKTFGPSTEFQKTIINIFLVSIDLPVNCKLFL